MKRFACLVSLLAASANVMLAESWTGRLVDAICKASSDGANPSWSCAATQATHLYAIELPDSKVLNLDALGNKKVSAALESVQKTDLRATATGSLQGQTVKVEGIEIQK